MILCSVGIHNPILGMTLSKDHHFETEFLCQSCICIQRGDLLVSNVLFQKKSIHPSPPMIDIFLTHFPLQSSAESSFNNFAFETPLPLGISQTLLGVGVWMFSVITQFSLLQSGLKVVKVRAEAMQKASDQVPSGLVSIMGHADLDIQLLCRDAEEWSYNRGTQEPVARVANYLFPGGWVLGGDKSSVQYILEYGKAKVRLRST